MTPNQALEPAASSVRCALATGRGSPPAFGFQGKKQVRMRLTEEISMWGSTIGGIVTLILSLLAVPLSTGGQTGENIPPVGALVPGFSAVTTQSCLGALQQGLRDLVYVEGQHITFAYRSAENESDRLPALAADLVRSAPDVLWTYSMPAARAAKQATTTIPIAVAISGGELVEQGLVESQVLPGGNLTGLEIRETDV
jgi:ABC-type uncharacterized transport system substrate-binding protein